MRYKNIPIKANNPGSNIVRYRQPSFLNI